MEAYLNKGIKQIIHQFPEVENVLEEYGIGCAPCSVGTCLLKDIVEIHYLDTDQEQKLMTRITNIIYPGKVIKLPQIKRKNKAKLKEISYSPPVKRLVEEHVLIKRWLALIPEVIKNLEVESAEGRQTILDGVDFIRSYADKYHHAKEEEILFNYFDEDMAILKVMHEDHKQARGHVKAMLEALDRQDKEAIARHLSAYGDLLSEHIKKEDEILYPWMDKNLSVTQIGELFSRFNEADEQIGYSSLKYEEFINRSEEKFKQKEVIE